MIPASRAYPHPAPPLGVPAAQPRANVMPAGSGPVSVTAGAGAGVGAGAAGWGRPAPNAGLAPDAQLETVAREFEALFLSQLLRDARKGGLGDGLLDSAEARSFQDMLDTEIARGASGGMDLGIARALVGQLSPAVGAGR